MFFSTLTHQPDPQTAFADFAAYVTTNQFLVSHLVGSIAGAAIGSIGVIALMLHLQGSKVEGRAITGMVATVTGNTLVTAIFGVAAFAQPAMGRLYFAGQQNALDFYNQVYAGPLFGTALAGLLLFVVGGVFTGIAIAASGCLPRWAGWLYGVTSVGFVLSNFLLPAGMTVMSALLFAATIAIAWSAMRVAHRQVDRVRTPQGAGQVQPDVAPCP
jgi:hypothetical protein